MHAPGGTASRIDRLVDGCQANSRPTVLSRKPGVSEVNDRARCVCFQAQHPQEAQGWASVLKVPDFTLSLNGKTY